MGIILLLSDRNNSHTRRLMKLWPEICDSINEQYPSIQFIEHLDYRMSNLPKSFEIYYVWFPIIIYISDMIWNQIISNKPVDLKTQTSVMNGFFNKDNKLRYIGKHDKRKPSDYIKWLNHVAIFEDDGWLIKEPIDY
jgi:hypothetical protein